MFGVQYTIKTDATKRVPPFPKQATLGLFFGGPRFVVAIFSSHILPMLFIDADLARIRQWNKSAFALCIAGSVRVAGLAGQADCRCEFKAHLLWFMRI